MQNRESKSENNIEHFVSNGGIAGIIIFITMLLMFAGYILWPSITGSSSMKYLTSSTSPGFDLTFTPNM